jgi:hypothetical protein
MHVYFCFEVPIDLVPPSYKVKRADRRMMANLLTINWAAIDEALECLSKDRIEGFLNIKVKNTISKSECYALFEPF